MIDIFPDYTKDKRSTLGKSYNLTKYFVSLLEIFVGKEFMEKMYSKNQIYLLESVLNYFMGAKRTNKFFFALDLISLYVDDTTHPSLQIKFKCYKFCTMYLFDLYVRYAQMQYLEDSIGD